MRDPNEELLTNEQIARLKDAGVAYPWSGRDSLALLEGIDAERAARQRAEARSENDIVLAVLDTIGKYVGLHGAAPHEVERETVAHLERASKAEELLNEVVRRSDHTANCINAGGFLDEICVHLGVEGAADAG